MTTNEAIDTLMGVRTTTLFAAFSENGDLWPTTIRRTLADAVEALKREPGIDPAQPFAGGINMGSFKFRGGPLTGWNLRLPADAPITWIPMDGSGVIA